MVACACDDETRCVTCLRARVAELEGARDESISTLDRTRADARVERVCASNERDLLRQQVRALTRERDEARALLAAYKRAKSENDERLMIERNEAREKAARAVDAAERCMRERDAARARVAELEAALRPFADNIIGPEMDNEPDDFVIAVEIELRHYRTALRALKTPLFPA